MSIIDNFKVEEENLLTNCNKRKDLPPAKSNKLDGNILPRISVLSNLVKYFFLQILFERKILIQTRIQI